MTSMVIDSVPDTSSSSSSSATPSDANDHLPWVEKYRPSLIQDVVGNEEAVSRLQIIAKEGNLPNIIISGPPGTGKTTSILCLAHSLLGPSYRDAVLELNASDDRGIDAVRNKIKMFAQKKVKLEPGKHKIIILDEADSMTGGAQQALRRIMEIYSSTTRFALACNTSSNIIEPIQSRCCLIRFSRLNDKQVLSRLKYIMEQEKVTWTEDGVETLLYTADGDMRQAINNLQSTYTGFRDITNDNVLKVCDQPHPMILRSIIDLCLRNELDNALKSVISLYNSGYSSLDIITTLFKVLKYHDSVPEYLRLEFIREIGLMHVRILNGVNSWCQLTGLIAKLCRIVDASAAPK